MALRASIRLPVHVLLQQAGLVHPQPRRRGRRAEEGNLQFRAHQNFLDGSECYANTKVKSLETAFKFSYIAYDIVEEPAETQAEN